MNFLKKTFLLTFCMKTEGSNFAKWLICCSLQVCLSLPQSVKLFLFVVTLKYSTWQVCFTL